MTTRPAFLTPVSYFPDLLLGLGTFTLYGLTLAPGLLPADAGEFQTAVPLLGVLHPPGFVLYTLLGKLFTLVVPLGDPAWRLNLFAAFTSALTVVAVYRAGRLLDRSGWMAGVAALALAVSTTFWAQATTANIRSLTALFTALMAWAWLAHWQQPTPRRLALLSLALAGGVLHHASLAFSGLVLGGAALWPVWQRLRAGDQGWRATLLALSAGLIWLPLLLYLPLRAGAWGAPPGLANPSGFFEHVLATGFESDFFYHSRLSVLPERLAIFGNILVFQFGLGLTGLFALGLLAACWPDWRIGATFTVAIGVHVYIAMTYRAPQTVEYLLPAYVLAAVALAALGQLGQWQARIAAVVVALMAVSVLAQNWAAYRQLAADDSTAETARATLLAAPPDATILAPWHAVTPLWYLHDVAGLRPDVYIRYVYPEGDSLAATWVARIAEYATHGPVVVTGFYPEAYAAAGFDFSPLGGGWLLDGAVELPQTMDVAFEDWRLVGAARPAEDGLMPGEEFRVDVAWAGPADDPVILFVQLIGPDGMLYGGVDVPVGNLGADGVAVRRFDGVVAQNALPGVYRLVAGAYRPDGVRLTTATGDNHLTLATLTVEPATQPPVSVHPSAVGPLAGYDYDHTLPDSTRLWLHWRLGSQPRTWTLVAGGQPIGSFEVPGGVGYVSTAHDIPPGWRAWQIESNGQVIRLADPQPYMRYVPLGGRVVLTEVWMDENDSGIAVRLGWQATRPLLDDAVVKVDWLGVDYAWRAQSDGIPAGGAIPTLKWLPGPVIYDRHTFTWQPEWRAPSERLELAVYDHFTQRVYAIGDPRLAALGSTVVLDGR